MAMRLHCPNCDEIDSVRAIPAEDIVWDVEIGGDGDLYPASPRLDHRETWRYYCARCAYEPEDRLEFVVGA